MLEGNGKNRIIRYEPGEIIKMKKAHPCGSREWEVLSPGVDYKLRCRGCGREIMIPRIELGRRIKQ